MKSTTITSMLMQTWSPVQAHKLLNQSGFCLSGASQTGTVQQVCFGAQHFGTVQYREAQCCTVEEVSLQCSSCPQNRSTPSLRICAARARAVASKIGAVQHHCREAKVHATHKFCSVPRKANTPAFQDCQGSDQPGNVVSKGFWSRSEQHCFSVRANLRCWIIWFLGQHSIFASKYGFCYTASFVLPCALMMP